MAKRRALEHLVDQEEGRKKMAKRSEQAGLMTTQDVADYMQVTLRYVYKLQKERGLPLFKIGRIWRCRKADLERWLTARKRESA